MSNFFAITAYYNPVGYTSRYENYKLFHDQLHCPLLAVELNQSGNFELKSSDADLLIQLRGETRIWQKERLLNLAIARLPPTVEYVAWLDCDIIFENSNWISKTIAKLNNGFDLVQPFKGVIHQGAQQAGSPPRQTDWQSGLDEVAAGFLIEQNEFTFENLGCRGMMPAHGHAWASKTSFVARYPFYDKCIVGGGDTFYIAACLGKLQTVIEQMNVATPLSQDMKAHYADMPSVKFGYSSNKVFHLYHGDFINRRYNERHSILTSQNFDPVTDLTGHPLEPLALSSTGARVLPHLKAYLESRKEDQGWAQC